MSRRRGRVSSRDSRMNHWQALLCHLFSATFCCLLIMVKVRRTENWGGEETSWSREPGLLLAVFLPSLQDLELYCLCKHLPLGWGLSLWRTGRNWDIWILVIFRKPGEPGAATCCPWWGWRPPLGRLAGSRHTSLWMSPPVTMYFVKFYCSCSMMGRGIDLKSAFTRMEHPLFSGTFFHPKLDTRISVCPSVLHRSVTLKLRPLDSGNGWTG